MLNIGLVGATGFTGQELIRLLSNHPLFKLKWATSTTMAEKYLSEVSPALQGLKSNLKLKPFSPELAAEVEAVFLALPHSQAMSLVPALLEVNPDVKVVDLAADYRLPAALFSQWYQVKHKSPSLIDRFVYGLTEINKEKIKGAQLVANPGCYATAVLLAIAPLLASQNQPRRFVANCLSGVSGAGRKASDLVHFNHLNENIVPYKPGWQHRHLPEIKHQAEAVFAAKLNLSFTPQIVPINRGILATVFSEAVKLKEANLYQLYKDFYAQAFFVRLLPTGKLPEVKAVLGSNFCQLGLAYNEANGELLVFAALDNLVKGAAGQALQNLNLMFNLPEETGLEATGVYP